MNLNVNENKKRHIIDEIFSSISQSDFVKKLFHMNPRKLRAVKYTTIGCTCSCWADTKRACIDISLCLKGALIQSHKISQKNWKQEQRNMKTKIRWRLVFAFLEFWKSYIFSSHLPNCDLDIIRGWHVNGIQSELSLKEISLGCQFGGHL